MSRIPHGTYRLQLHADFGFDAAAAISDYLEKLGISHVYSSPYLQAAPGSKHGYDVVDQHKVNEELGGAEAHDRFSNQLGKSHLGQVLDIVPNHMAISGRRNHYWWDVLQNGPASRYASYFDIDWNPYEEKLRNKLLVPILGDHYGRVLNRKEIAIQRNAGTFFVKYFDNELPAAPKSLPLILIPASRETGSDQLAFLADCLDDLPAASESDPGRLLQRHRDHAMISSLLVRLFNEVPFIGDAVDRVINEINSNADRLDEFLEHQNYRLALWKTSEQDLGYRRFFDVNTLVGLRMEDPKVYADTHALIINWLREGVLDGIRVDHPDGLRDPRQYFERLRTDAPDVWILGEKILEPGEKLRAEWPIDGTTGYDYLNLSAGLMIDRSSEKALTDFYAAFTGDATDYAAVCHEKKHKVLRELLGSDVNRLTTLFTEICESHRDRRDFTRQDVNRAIREIVASFPVYRTYVVPARDEITQKDIEYVNQAIELSKNTRPELDPELFDFFADVLLLRVRGEKESEFVMRFQQFCGPAMAKGVEDTVFYDFNRLISLNEVGGDPGVFGICPKEFHAANSERQKTHPRAMLASSTHDTKRSEDVRARISVLSEIPNEWKAAVQRWSNHNRRHKTHNYPDHNTEYFLYQTMLGAWPIGTDRLLPYMEKACREGKRHTNWLTPNEEFESAVKKFVEGIYKDEEFLHSFEEFLNRLIQPGRINSLAQTLLKFTVPGIPDTYQGSEIWDLSLVDPDNRRPVDFELRRRLLAEFPRLKADDVMKRADEGLPKLWTIYHALKIRNSDPAAFGDGGSYNPVNAAGPKQDHALAFVRGGRILVAVPLLTAKLAGDWGDTTLEIPAGTWNNVLSGAEVQGGRINIGNLLSAFPVGLLVKR